MSLRTVAVITALLLGGAVVIDIVTPAAEPSPRAITVHGTAGILSCPNATEGRGRAYLHLFNDAPSTAAGRVSIVSTAGKVVAFPFRVGAGLTRTVRLDGRVPGRASASIEYTGGRLIATHSVWVRPVSRPVAEPGGAAMAACVAAGAADVVIPHARTFGARARLVVFNPGSADADVTITLLANGRAVHPERLSKRVIRSGQRREFRLEDFVFDARELAAIIHADAGRVVAEVFLSSTRGVSLIPAHTPETATVAAVPVTGPRSLVGMTVVGENDVGIDARIIAASSQRSARGITSALAPAGSRRIRVAGKGEPRAIAFDVTAGGSLAAGSSWVLQRKDGGDEESLPAVGSTTRWAGAIGSYVPKASFALLVVNAGANDAHLRVRVAGPRPGRRDARVGPGRLAAIRIGRGVGTLGVSVESDAPVAVFLIATAVARGVFVGQLATPADPVVPASPVAVAYDPSQGLPAPLVQ